MTARTVAHARYGVPVREGEHADYYRGSGDVDDIVDWPDR